MRELLRLLGLVPVADLERLHDKIMAQSEHIDLLVKEKTELQAKLEAQDAVIATLQASLAAAKNHRKKTPAKTSEHA